MLNIVYLFYKKDTDVKLTDIPNSVEETEWKTYVNEEYGFSIEYPSYWKFKESDMPAFNFYPPLVKDPETQYIHHDNVTHVSIYPQGVASEIVRGETVESETKLDYQTKTNLDYVLTNGKKWATFIEPGQNNSNWKPWGFIWAGQEVKNPEYGCISNDKDISIEECDPFFDQFTRSGSIDSNLTEIEERMIKSFKFID